RRQSHPARGADVLRGGDVPTELLDAGRRSHRRGDSRAGAATHQGPGRGGGAPMRATILCAALAVAGCVEKRSPPPPPADSPAAAAPAPAPPPVAPPVPPPPPASPAPPPPKALGVGGVLPPGAVLPHPAPDMH